MKKILVLCGMAAALMLGACEQEQVAETPVVGEREGVAGTPVTPQEREGVAQEQQPLTQEPPPPGQEQQAMTQPGQEQEQQQAMAQQPAEEQQAGQEPPMGQQETAQQPGAQQEKTEFFGQSPEFGNAPEVLTLEAKNGNVKLTHKAHAEMMDCQTCHGAGTPGKIADFSKDKAHDLCMGCHKEKGAGPTKCPECHVKQ